jgi:peptide/nickel transport system permease protein
MDLARTTGLAVLGIAATAALAAPVVAPHRPGEQFRDLALAPPMRVHLRDEAGRWGRPFVYPLRLVDRLERRYREDRTRPVPLVFGRRGRLVQTAEEPAVPLLLLGADSLGRDVFARLVYGARVSLGAAALALAGTVFLGVLVGAAAGYAGGRVEALLMRLADFVLVMPTLYVVLALRTALPLVLPAWIVFLALSLLLALVGWPYVARGVRAIIAAERRRDYVEAARSLGAGPVRLLGRHLLPAAGGYVATQALLLLPAFVLAEATLSYVGLGFPDEVPSWGAMLQEAADIRVAAEFPWILAPAGALVLVTAAVNLIMRSDWRGDVLTNQGLTTRGDGGARRFGRV